ncbi:MAG: ABC transporter permease subunit [Eubacteriales bacterium]|nr:ABC transporter permease subunit [Eubacteriales bacterium]
MRKKSVQNIISLAVALALWQGAAMLLNKPLLFASPVEVIARLFSIYKEPLFFKSIISSLLNIALGFVLGLFIAFMLGALAGKYGFFEIMLRPYVTAIKTVPIASFIILALLWISPERLSVSIAFLIVFPVVYQNTLEGLRSVEKELIHMARVFKVPAKRRIKMLYLPKMKPYILSAASSASGMAWKAGVAAELIGRPDFSLGAMLYEAKIYINTADLFCYTLVIIFLSRIFEKAMLYILKRLIGGKYAA